MSIKGIDANTSLKSDTPPTTKTEAKMLSQDDFMKLFLAQMKTQSPLKPFDSSDMMQQMSQLTSLSSSQQLEKTVKMLNTNMGQSQMLSATQIIGKKVAIPSTISPLNDKEGLKGSVLLPMAATNITIEISDGAKLVKTINIPRSPSGIVDFQWDGLDAENNVMHAGYYNISATANINGRETSVPTAGVYNVNSVTMDRKKSSVILNVEGIGGTGMEDIIKILS